MKIAFYIDTLQLGGAERVMANLCNSFSEKGNEVLLINDVASPDNIREYELNKSIRREYIADYNRKSTLIYNINRLKKLRKTIKDFSPDVSISFLGPPNIRMLLSTIGLKNKKIVSVRNDPFQEYGSGIKRFFANLIFLLADGYVFQTEDAKSYFFKPIQNKGRIILNPVNEVFFNQPNEIVEKNMIIFVGRLQKQKNPSMLIHAFNQLKEKYREYKIVYLGDGELREELLKLVDNYGLQNNVLFVGQVSNVYDWLVSASLYVLTSDFEGLPNALMEAMALGVPVIATDCPCGGPRELIKGSDQGFLIPCGDINILAGTIDRILSNKKLRDRMRVEASKRAEEFHPDKIFNKWEKYFETIIDN